MCGSLSFLFAWTWGGELIVFEEVEDVVEDVVEGRDGIAGFVSISGDSERLFLQRKGLSSFPSSSELPIEPASSLNSSCLVSTSSLLLCTLTMICWHFPDLNLAEIFFTAFGC